MWRRVRAETGFKDLRIHDLRRTVGSWLVRDGASLHLVGAVLNHKDQKTTAGYAYFQTKERHKALDKHGRNVIDFASRVPAASRDARKAHLELLPIYPPIVGNFTPSREKRYIGSSGRSRHVPYQNSLAYRMSVSQRRVGGRTSQLPIAGTGREWPPAKSVKRHLCPRSNPVGWSSSEDDPLHSKLKALSPTKNWGCASTTMQIDSERTACYQGLGPTVGLLIQQEPRIAQHPIANARLDVMHP